MNNINSILNATELLLKRVERNQHNTDLQIALYESGISIDSLKMFITELELVAATNEEKMAIK